MPPQKVCYLGENAGILHLLRASSGGALEVEQVSNTHVLPEETASPDVGMLVLDHEPSSVDSFAALRRLKRQHPDLPVLVLTSDYTADTTKLLLRSGAEEVLPTSVNLENLLACYEAFFPGFGLAQPRKRSRKKPSAFLGSPLLMAAAVPGLVVAGLEGGVPPVPPPNAPALLEQSEEQFYNGLEINYFGVLSVRLNGRTVEFTRQAKLLFAYLAYHYPKAQSRDHLARVFWPIKQDNQPECARRSLNVELNHVRRALMAVGANKDLVTFKNNCYHLCLDAPLRSDVATFRQISQQIQLLVRDGKPVEDALFQEAIHTYSSNFLEDCPDNALNWVDVERQRLGAQFEQIADLYSAKLSDQGDYYRATAVCQEILSRDPRMEAIHRRLIYCFGKLGMFNKVEQQFRILCQIMEQEFNSKPSADTVRMYQQTRGGA